MPESFLQQMSRVHNTKPIMNARDTDERSIQLFGGIGVRTGFHVVTDPSGDSRSVQVTRGIVVGPNGGELTTGNDSSRTTQESAKAVVGDVALVNVAKLLGDAVYDGIDPVAHSILLTIDSVNHGFKAHMITAAEKTSISGAITDLDGDGVPEFDAATADHAARGRINRKNPDNLNAAAVDVASEFIIAILDKDASGAGGVIDTVAMERERAAWTAFVL